MSEHFAELSSDLEWMLKSGQATGEMLVGALASQYYAPVFRLANAVLGKPDLAHQVTCETLGRAAANVYRIPEWGSIQVWLFSIAVDNLRRARKHQASKYAGPDSTSHSEHYQAVQPSDFDQRLWQAFDRLPERTRLPVLLRFLLEWQEDEIAALLHLSLSSVRYQMIAARKRFMPAILAAGPQNNDLDAHKLEKQFMALFQARWPAPVLTSLQLQAVVPQAMQYAVHDHTRQERFFSVQEGFWMVGTILIVVTIFWAANRLSPSEPAADPPPPVVTELRIKSITREPKVVIATAQATPTPPQALLESPEIASEAELIATPVTPAPQPEPLTMASTSAEIRTRLVDSGKFWNTLWLDATILDYGPSNYIGPPRATHLQAWINSLGTRLLIEGPDGGRADRAMAVWNWRTVVFDLAAGDMTEQKTPALMDNPQLKAMVFPRTSQWADPIGKFLPLNLSEISGREVLGVDWISSQGSRQASLAIDTLTGVILSATWLDQDEYARIIVRVNKFFLDVNFPATHLFLDNLESREFATDYTGSQLATTREQPASLLPEGRERLPIATPAPGFDPAGKELLFQYPVGLSTRTNESQVELFAGGVYLGQVMFGNPWNMICDRSPDGERLAFASNPNSLTTVGSRLHSISLADLQVVESPLGRISSLAFAPDSRRLAVAGSRVGSPQRGIFIWDTQTQDLNLVLPVIDAKSLVWSPDGNSLAMIANIQAVGEDEVLVVNVKTGNVIYRDPVDIESGSDTTAWPMLKWGVNFPVEMKGMEGCR